MGRSLGVVLLVLTAASTSVAAEVDGTARAEASGRTALVVVDVQAFYFPGGKLPLVEPEAAVRQAGRALAAFRQRGWPVVHVQHLPEGVDRPDPAVADAQYRFRAEVLPIAGEKLVGKC